MIERLKNYWAYATTRSGRAVAALEAENHDLREQLAQRVMNETFVTGMFFGNGGFNLGYQGGAAQLLAESLAQQFETTGAVNYLEISFTSKHITPGSSYLVTIQKCTGMTPHQFRLAAERELSELRATLTPNVAIQGPPIGGPAGMESSTT